MQTKRLLAVSALSSSLLAACGGEDLSGGSTTGGAGADRNALSFETGEFDVPPGESFECIYTDVTTDRELNAVSAVAQQSKGGHHVIIFYTDTPRDPQHHPCVESEMVAWNQIVGAPGAGQTSTEGLIKMPEGLAIKVPSGSQLVIQTHYINTTGAAFKTNDKITLNTVDAAEVKYPANLFVVIDAGFTIPPEATYKSVTTCTVDEDRQTVILTGHMHEHGTNYTLEEIDDQGKTKQTLYQQKWAPQFASHPPIIDHPLDAPFLLSKGTKLRQTCEWANNTATSMAFPTEMCVGIFYFFPGESQVICNAQPAQP